MSVKTTTDLKGKIDFGIITIREDEYDAVLRRFPSDELVNGPNRIYSLTRVTFTRTFNYLIACAPSIEQGGGHAQDAARDMIEDLDPNLILLVGIAGAVPDMEFTLGDVVVAKRLHDFSVGAAIEGRNLQASNQGGPMHKLIQNLLAQLPALKKLLGDWNTAEQIGMNRPALLPDKISVYADEEWATKVTRSLTAHFGPGVAVRAPIVTARSIASGNILVKDTRTLRDWLERARELAAIEMELNGVYIAARRADREYPILAIRGISDIVGLQRDPIWTPYACEVAASCARAFVNAQLLAPRSDSGIPKISDLEPDPLRFEQFCNSLRDRRVGEGDDFGGDIVSGNIIGSETRLPKRALGGDALVLHFVPESAAIKPPIQADLAILQSHSSLLDDVQSWIDHSVNFKGYHYTLYPLKKRRRNADGLLLYTSQEREDDHTDQYVQIHADGIVEAVDYRIMGQVLHSRVIPGMAIELAIAKIVPAILDVERLLGFEGHVWIAATILAGMEYVSVSYDEEVSAGPHYIGRRHRLLLPPIDVDLNADSPTLKRKLAIVCDSLAHAGGWDKSPSTSASATS